MKFIACIFVLSFVAISNASDKICVGDVLQSVLDQCVAANGGDSTMIEMALHDKKPTNENERCFYACEMLECNVMLESGAINPEIDPAYPKLLSPNDPAQEQRIANAIEICAKIPINENKCTTAGDYINCINDNCENCKFDLSVLLHLKF